MKKKIMKKLFVITCCLVLAFGSSIKNVHAVFVIDDLAAIGLVTALAFATGITIKCATDEQFKTAVTSVASSAWANMGAGIKSACYEAGAAGKWSVSKLNEIKGTIGNWWNSIYNTMINPPSFDTTALSAIGVTGVAMSSNVVGALCEINSKFKSYYGSITSPRIVSYYGITSSDEWESFNVSPSSDPSALIYSLGSGSIQVFGDMALKSLLGSVYAISVHQDSLRYSYQSLKEFTLALSSDVNWYLNKDYIKSAFGVTIAYSGIFYSCATHAWYTGLDMTTKLKDIVLGQPLGDIDIADEGYKVPNSIDNVKPDSYTLTGPDATYDTTTHERYWPGTVDLPDTLTRDYPDTLDYPYVTDIPDDVTVPDTYNPTDVQTKDPEPTYVDPDTDDKYKIDWHDVFPLCIPWDLVAMMKALNADPVAPNVTWNYDLAGNKGKLKIDLAQFDDIAKILRTMELLAFAVGLAYVTRYLIKG